MGWISHGVSCICTQKRKYGKNSSLGPPFFTPLGQKTDSWKWLFLQLFLTPSPGNKSQLSQLLRSVSPIRFLSGTHASQKGLVTPLGTSVFSLSLHTLRPILRFLLLIPETEKRQTDKQADVQTATRMPSLTILTEGNSKGTGSQGHRSKEVRVDSRVHKLPQGRLGDHLGFSSRAASKTVPSCPMTPWPACPTSFPYPTTCYNNTHMSAIPNAQAAFR